MLWPAWGLASGATLVLNGAPVPALDPRYLDHFQHPRHATRLEAPDVEVSAENPVCGDELTLGIRLADGRICDLGFAVRGCSGSIAGASALCELALGQTPESAAEIKREAVEAALGGLPQLKRHGADLAVDALQRALAALAAAPPPQPQASVACEETL
ncbi:MAG: iron-sulfur cluster assembly scaffold protein [Planctomycetes bacterium]|nr:iron-sulfur cluster assembly scaffold protein [Planctomycetota bacterium]